MRRRATCAKIKKLDDNFQPSNLATLISSSPFEGGISPNCGQLLPPTNGSQSVCPLPRNYFHSRRKEMMLLCSHVCRSIDEKERERESSFFALVSFNFTAHWLRNSPCQENAGRFYFLSIEGPSARFGDYVCQFCPREGGCTQITNKRIHQA